MKRWSFVVLLLLLPLTMAPRTSLTPVASELEVNLVVSRTAVEAGDRVNLVLQTRNQTETDFPRATSELSIHWTGKSDSLLVVGLPDGCSHEHLDQEHVVECRLGALRSGQQKTVAYALVPLEDGELTVRAGGFGTAIDGDGRPEQTIVVGEGAPAGDR